jgi:Ion channel/PD-(D/E)XK nuclease superfamily
VPSSSSATRSSPSTASAARALHHARVREPSWAATSVTGETARLAAAERAKKVAVDEAAATAVPDTPSHRADAGLTWGTLIHGLLKHAMRHEGATRDDLARLAWWLTVETPDLRAFIPEALDLVAAVSKAPFWQEARAGAEVLVEVPFAVRLEPGTSIAGDVPIVLPTVLRGVIDLAYRAGDGWRILDYKTVRGLRALRLLRLLRLLRAVAFLTIGLKFAHRALQHHQFHYVVLFATAVVGSGAIGIYVVERGTNRAIESFPDALWWAVVTATTVGYGDVSPVTAEGRLIAVVVMITGIAVVSAFTATIASYLFGRDKESEAAKLEARLGSIEVKLDELLKRDPDV